MNKRNLLQLSTTAKTLVWGEKRQTVLAHRLLPGVATQTPTARPNFPRWINKRFEASDCVVLSMVK